MRRRSVSLARMAAEGQGEEKDLRRISRLLRVHFKRVRPAAIGPDRSHRRTMVDRIVHVDSVRQAVAAKARRDKIEIYQAEALARKYAREIAADYSYSFIRIAEILLNWFWNRIYRGIQVFHFSSFREAQQGYEIVYVPCHRSHIDYMLLSFILYRRGFVPAHRRRNQPQHAGGRAAAAVRWRVLPEALVPSAAPVLGRVQRIRAKHHRQGRGGRVFRGGHALAHRAIAAPARRHAGDHGARVPARSQTAAAVPAGVYRVR